MHLNGVDTGKMSDMAEIVEQQPELGRFRFRARNRWINGGRTQTTISDFYGADAE